MPGLTILHGCRTIQLTRGMNTLMDEADSPIKGHTSWQARKGKRTFYAATAKNIGDHKFRSFQLHRILTAATDGAEVDHRNGDGLDNRRSNLRIVTPQSNSRNRRRCVGQSRFKGVSPLPNGTWRAGIAIAKKRIHLGCFPDEESAARAYDVAAIEHFGEFACTNTDIHGPY